MFRSSRNIFAWEKIMVTDKYEVGDLICLNPSNILHTYDLVDCDSGPAHPHRFGLAVDDGVTAIILDIKEDPNYGGEIVLLIGLQKAYMTFQPGQKPDLRKITIN